MNIHIFPQWGDFSSKIRVTYFILKISESFQLQPAVSLSRGISSLLKGFLDSLTISLCRT